MQSFPRYRRGVRWCPLTDRYTRRLAEQSSSAIWQPELPEPTMSTAPGGRSSGFRYWLECSCRILPHEIGEAAGYLKGPGRDHHISRLEASGRGLDHETRRSGLLTKRCRCHAAAYRCADGGGISLDVSHNVVTRREGIRIGRLMGETGEPHIPIRSLKAKRVPPLASPPLCDAPAFEDDVLATALAKIIAHREAGLASAYDHSFNPFP